MSGLSQNDLDYCINLIANLRHTIRVNKDMGQQPHRDVVNQLHTFEMAARGDFSVPQLEELNRRCNEKQLDLQLEHNANLKHAEEIYQHNRQNQIHRNASRGIESVTSDIHPTGKKGLNRDQWTIARNTGKFVERGAVNKNLYTNKVFDDLARQQGISRKEYIERLDDLSELERKDPRLAAEKAANWNIDGSIMNAWADPKHGSLKYTASEREWKRATKEDKQPVIHNLDESALRKISIIEAITEKGDIPYDSEPIHPKTFNYDPHCRTADVAAAYQAHETHAKDMQNWQDDQDDTLRSSLSNAYPTEEYGSDFAEEYRESLIEGEDE